MDLNRVGVLANIGNFIVGCFALYLMWHPSQPSTAVGGSAVNPLNSINPAMWIFLGGLLIAGALHIGAAIIQMGGFHHDLTPGETVNVKSQGKSSTAKEGRRIFVGSSTTPQYLVGLLKGVNSLQVKNAILPYIGKWMKVSGLVTHVGGELTIIVVLLAVNAEPNSEFTICAVFRGQWKEQLEILREGDALNIVGRIEKIEEFPSRMVTLINCEIIDS